MTSTEKECDLRIVLLGKSGSGKSATGNTILGRDAFKVVDFINSANKLCEKQEGKVCGKTVSVIDTPGLFNTDVTKRLLKNEIEKCVEMSIPGPHVFLLVLKLGVRFTKEERDAVKCIQEDFGDEALCRTIILFTHADRLKGKPVDEYINKSNNLKEIVDSCGDRYHSFNNEDRKSQDQVTQLMKKIDAMMEENIMNHYTLEMFKTTPKKRKRAKMVGVGIRILQTVDIAGIISGAAVEQAAASAVADTREAAGEAVDVVCNAFFTAAETSSEAVINQVVAAVEKAAKTLAVSFIGEAAGEAVQTAAGGSGGAVAGVAGTAMASAVSAVVARAAAAAGKVATSGRVSVVAAAAAAFGGAAVTVISALKP